MSDSTGLAPVDMIVIWSLAAVAVAGAVTLLWRATRWVRRIAVRIDDVVDDWQGVPDRPGVPGRPGVMSRLDSIEQRLGRVEHELHPNDGHSLRDAVDRVDRRTARSTPTD